ncbi:hypothetical protein C1H46_001303 [Malus baccata]|uniref:GST N-terminal domain-containing protein n=1 Tax=Malus baccata TaxID=106549 RepID=A0A540NQC4_MALBA|nr:hypothetical protein C1H46_001303 [Malus baccata]
MAYKYDFSFSWSFFFLGPSEFLIFFFVVKLIQDCFVSGCCRHEELPPPLDSTSSPPHLFDGTTRLYVNYTCPFAQRVWITRNYKGLQDKIKLVGIDLENRPAWYKEKVYPGNKVPSLEHNGKVIGESLDLIKYLESNFEGPSLVPNDDPERKKFGEELLSYVDTFVGSLYRSLKGDTVKAAGKTWKILPLVTVFVDEFTLNEFG